MNIQHIPSDNFNIYIYQYETICSSININTELGYKLSKVQNPNGMIEKFLAENNSIDIYTDGSKTSESVGSAVVCPPLNIKIQSAIAKNASTFTAESIALSEAINIVYKHPENNFAIFIDSLSVLQSLKNNKLSIKQNNNILKIKEIHNKALAANPQRKIEFIWIPSHTMITGNEAADLLAKEAAKNSTLDNLPIPFLDYYHEYKQSADVENNRIIVEQSQTKGNKYFKLFHNTYSSP